MDRTEVKLWALYPGPCNREVYQKESAANQQYAQCEESLNGGRFAVTLPDEGTVLPPAWLHVTLTINSGALFGSTISVAEGVFEAAQIFAHDVLTKGVVSFDDLRPLVRSLHAAVVAGLEDRWREALSCLCKLDLNYINKKQGESEIKALTSLIQRLLEKEVRPLCLHCSVELGMQFPLKLSSVAKKVASRRQLRN
jgi:hypothetical protein